MASGTEQGMIWGARANDWAECNEPAWHDLFSAVLDHAGLGPGDAMLDVGCGAGGALVLAGGRGASVAGLDAAASLVAIARRRLPQAEIEVGEMEQLPFANGRFDLVTGINAFQFASNPVNALREAGRVCRTSGTVAMLVWGKRENCELLTRVMPAVFSLLPPPPPDAPKPLPLAEPGVVEGMMVEAGLEPQGTVELPGVLAFPELDTAVRAVLSACARAIAHAGEARVRDGVAAALAPMVTADGRVELHNIFRLTKATRH